MGKGGSVSTLLTIGVIGAVAFLAWDYFGNPPCQKMIPFFNAGCPGGAGGSSWGGLGEKVGLVMDPMRVGKVLRSAQKSAEGKYNVNADQLLKDAIKRGNQPVKTHTWASPPGAGPKSTGASQAIGPRTIVPPSSGAPDILSKFFTPKSRFNPKAQSQIKAETYLKSNPKTQYNYLKPGRPIRPQVNPFAWDGLVKAINEALFKGTPKSIQEYIEWIKVGGKDPGLRIWESLGGQTKGGKPVIGPAKPILRR